MASRMKPWYQVVTPREDLRENKPLDASEFAVHLDHIYHNAEAVPAVYREPRQFFDRTVWTRSLQDLTTQVARRLNGITVETSAVFNMATQFGGGKTHSLTALYHLANGGADVVNWRGIPEVLKNAQVDSVPKAAIAVFVGKSFDSLSGRGEDDEPKRRTPWGEIAWQLGGEESYRVVEQHDRDFVEPKGDVIRAMLPKDRPVLILMDEIISYVSSYRSQKWGDKLYNFLDCLAEEARGLKNVVVVVSIPASELEYTADDEADENRFKKMLDRVGRAISMSSDAEVTEIIRRRLFEWTGISEDARKTISEYADWAQDHATDLPEMAGRNGESIAALFRASYPFHPSVITVFERKWQTLPRFQRTRGVLRLLALWVARAYQEEHRQAFKEPLITLGSAPMEDQIFRDAVFEQLGSDRLITPVTTDIAGKKDAHAVRLDREATDAIKKARLHQKAATVIFFESNGGQSQCKAEASLPEIRAALGGPDLDLGNIETVLEGLLSNCYYLVSEKNRYRFGLAPNLNQMLVNRRANIRGDDLEERIKRETTELFNLMPQDNERRRVIPDRRFFPVKSNDIPDRAQLVLAVMSYEMSYGDPAAERLIENIIRESGSSGRTFKSSLLFCVPEKASAVWEDARSLLAWEDISEDTESVDRLDEAQRRSLKANLDRARRDLKESIFRSYRHVFLLGKDNKLQHEDLGQITSSQDASISNLVITSLLGNDIITKSVGATKLVRYWPPAMEEWSTKSVRDAFFASPSLPRLLDGNSIKRTIVDGVTQGLLGYAHKDAKGHLKLDQFNESISEDEIEIGEDAYIVTAEHARKLKEPPRLAKLEIRPNGVILKPNESSSMQARGLDQYGEQHPIKSLDWGATGGSITGEGLFVAGPDEGVFEVSVSTEGFEAYSQVRIRAVPLPERGSNGRGGADGDQLLLWSGEVPAQKWMNFYTKVISRFASSSKLKLRVSFEVDAEGDQGDRSLEDTRNALQELGLDPDARLE
ncbi:MAG: AAA family ATPase [Phycisphaerae bacterium]|nr:AAA family ATPase [Phycisphaerae bacterium]MBM91599.1 AAA family ATPase [Phycisphaerae bacterium]